MPIHVPQHIDLLIVRCMEGLANADEQRALAEWLAENDEHRAYLAQMEHLYFGIPADTANVDVDAAWKKVEERTATKVVSLAFDRKWKYLVAALVVGIALFVGYRWNGERTALQSTYVANALPVSEYLPDSTRVQLNSGAEVRYVQLNNGARIAQLKGEAYFEIHTSKKEKRSSFTVEAEGMRIEDIGTAFNVKALPGSDSVSVTVTDGKVIVFIPGETHEVSKGSTGIWIKSRQRFELLTAPEEQNGAAWANKSLKFRNTRMDKVIRKLSEVYNTSVILSDASMNDCRITATFDNESIESLLTILCETMGWNYAPVAGGYVLNGEGCADAEAVNSAE